MAVRPIDANAMLNELRPVGFEAEHSAVLLSDVSKMMREWVERQPTITPPNEWVSVEERLPEKKQDVLMLFDTGNMAVGWWHDADEHITFWCAYTDDGFYTDCDCIPTHWMLLPAPPEKEKE